MSLEKINNGRTVDDVFLKQQWDNDKNKVEDEHDHSHSNIESPVEGCYGGYDKYKHHE